MARQFFRLTFAEHLITEPIIYHMGQRFGLVTNVFRANVTQDKGWVLLQLEGKKADMNRAIAWAKEKGVVVDVAAEDDLKAKG